jgi:hypothetical protein
MHNATACPFCRQTGWPSLGVSISKEPVGKPEENRFAERLMRTIREEEIDLSE